MSNFDSFEPTKAYRTPSSAMDGAAGGLSFSSEDKTWALVAHLSPLAGFLVPIPFFNLIAPAIVWFLKRETMPVIDDQAKEVINFQITLTIAGLICIPLIFVFIGIFLAFALIVYGIVMAVLGAKAAQDGKLYRYPYCLRLL
jgi:uncharacterized Tic20 family protein